MSISLAPHIKWPLGVSLVFLGIGLWVVFWLPSDHAKLREGEVDYAFRVIFDDEWSFNPITAMNPKRISIFRHRGSTEPTYWIEAEVLDFDPEAFRRLVMSSLGSSVEDGLVVITETTLKTTSNKLGGIDPPATWRPSDIAGERQLLLVKRRTVKGVDSYARGCEFIYSARSDRIFVYFWQT